MDIDGMIDCCWLFQQDLVCAMYHVFKTLSIDIRGIVIKAAPQPKAH